MPGQQPDPAIQALLELIRCRCSQIHLYLAGTTQPRRWMIPPLRGWDGNPFNISDMQLPFDRTNINVEADNNLNALTGTVGIGGGKSLQINCLGMLERSFRQRHQSNVRALAHVAGRRKAHGEQNGIHTGDILSYLQNILDSGG